MSPSPADAGLDADGRVLVVAEIGSNHDGRLERALALVDAAAGAGADAVLFHSFQAARLVSGEGLASEAPADPHRRQRVELRAEWHAPLRDRAARAGLRFLSMPFDEARAALLAALGVPALPVAHSDVTHLSLLRALGGFGRPILLGTALADAGRIEVALAAIGEGAGTPARRPPVVLVTGPRERGDGAGDLRALETLAADWACPVGWSDRRAGTTLALGAVARGATLVVKPFADDRSRPSSEHAAVLDPEAFRALVVAVRDLERALGHPAPRARQPVARTAAVRKTDVA